MVRGRTLGYSGKLIGGGNETTSNTSNDIFINLFPVISASFKLSSDYIFMDFLDDISDTIYRFSRMIYTCINFD